MSAELLQAALSAGLSAGADEVELSRESTELHFARFASSRMTQVGVTRRHRVRARALRGGRLGAVMTGELSAEAIAAAAREAAELAEHTPALDAAFAFAEGAVDGEPAAPAIAPALLATEAPAELARAFSAETGVRFAGALKLGRHDRDVVTSRGLVRRAAGARAELSIIAEVGDASGYAGWSGSADAAPPFRELVARAADTARRAQRPRDLEPGEMDVVLAPEAVAELLEWMAVASFGADRVEDGTSLLSGRAGELVCDPRVTVAERTEPGDPPFDAEGTARRNVALIDAGRAAGPLSDRATAARLGQPSTGHAAPLSADAADAGPRAARLCLSPGDASDDELVARVDRGLYVTRFHYVNGLLDTRRATMTGMTRDGTFRIEGGRLADSAPNLRFTDHILEALSPGRLGGIGRDLREVATWWTDGGAIRTPALLLRAFRFTGRAR